ncbi:MMPL family transporter [Streptomyces sp. TE33382]
MRAWLKAGIAVPAGRRGKWIVLVGWLIAVMAFSTLAGKVGEVQDTSANAFLPRGAESTQVNTELEKFRTDELMAAVAVYSSDDVLGSDVRAAVEADRAAFAKIAAKGQQVPEAIPSKDGKALMVVVPLPSTDQAVMADKVEELRTVAAAQAPPGVETQVGGIAAVTTDAVKIFETLDSTLMAATALVVIILLLLTYRSPFLWLFPIFAVGFSSVLTQAGTYLFAEYAGLQVDPQSSGVLMVLVFAVGTDYALLLIARYREELYRNEDRHAAMRIALRRSGPTLLASAATVAVGLACLGLADMNSSRSMGLVGMIGVVFGFLAMVTILPALLVIAGRWLFWPLIPRYGTAPRAALSVWQRVGNVVAARPRRSWILSLAVTGVLALSAFGVNMGLGQSELLEGKPDSAAAQETLAKHYPSGSGDPAVVIAKTSQADAVAKAAQGTDGVVDVSVVGRTADDELTQLAVVLEGTPSGAAAKATVEKLRERTDALVGGQSAQTLDKENATERDLWVVVPAVLLVILLVLTLLLRSLVAPLILLATVVASYFAAFGAASFLFEHAMGYPGMDWSVPLLGFVFLVALGVDYNIFLMHRVKQESALHGHAQGVIAGLRSTGGVITSAGLVLAATFAVFAVLPLVAMAQMGTIVGIGVLIDTFLVRTILVPALALDLGARRFWWPAKPAAGQGSAAPGTSFDGKEPELERV